MSVDVEWDPLKAVLNLKKHGVRLSDGGDALEDPAAITRPDPDQPEPRFITLGMDGSSRLLVVVWTLHHDTARLVSARLATPRERRQYAEQDHA